MSYSDYSSSSRIDLSLQLYMIRDRRKAIMLIFTVTNSWDSAGIRNQKHIVCKEIEHIPTSLRSKLSVSTLPPQPSLQEPRHDSLLQGNDVTLHATSWRHLVIATPQQNLRAATTMIELASLLYPPGVTQDTPRIQRNIRYHQAPAEGGQPQDSRQFESQACITHSFLLGTRRATCDDSTCSALPHVWLSIRLKLRRCTRSVESAQGDAKRGEFTHDAAMIAVLKRLVGPHRPLRPEDDARITSQQYINLVQNSLERSNQYNYHSAHSPCASGLFALAG